MNRKLNAALFVGVSICAASVAQAQQAPQSTSNPSISDKDIIVTGTRLVTNGNNSPTPVTVLSVDQFTKLQPTTVTEAVNLLPALQGSQNVTSKPGGGQRNGAGAYFNLRNMGNLRTLVTVDGNRLIPTINQNQADTDAQVVPQLLLKRVDVVTGGVSAVYGSDAISGVINYVTDRDFNGFKFQAQQGISTYKDDPMSDIGLAYGRKFAEGRGHIEFSYQYHNDAGIQNRSVAGRPYADAMTGAFGNGTSVPYYNIGNQTMSNYTYGGLISSGALNGMMFTPSGQLTAFQHGLVSTTCGAVAYSAISASCKVVNANVESGGSGATYNNASLKAGLVFHQAFGRADYDFTDSIHGFIQGSYSNIHSFNNYQSPNLLNMPISNANPFLLQSVQQPYLTTLLANPNGTFNLNEILRNDPRADQYTENYSALMGLEGRLGGWKWNVNFQKAQSVIKAVNQQNIDNGRLYAALDSVNVGGQIVCRASLTNANYAGCSPLNPFGGIGSASQSALGYIFQQTYNINRTKMDDFNASITGSPFSTWAGPVHVAVSGEFRRLRWDVRSNASPNDLADCAGSVVTACKQGATTKWFFNTMSFLAPVSQRVTEGAAEAEVPLLRDVPFVKDLSLTGAVRFTHYNTSGDVTTWKVGGDWKVSDDLRFRVTRSRDVRAPNLFELYTPVQVNPVSTYTIPTGAVGTTTDGTALSTLAGKVVQGSTTYYSNTSLKPEKANTLTAGFVFTPTFLPRFSLSMDYYKIDVNNAILQLQGFSSSMVNLCLTSATPSALCSSQIGPITWNAATQTATGNTTSSYFNIAALHTWGIDTEVGYRFNAFKRPLNLRALVSYQPKLTYDQGPAGVLQDGGVYSTGNARVAAAPKWKVTGVVSYDVTDNFNITVLERWRGSLASTYAISTAPKLLVSNPVLPPMGYTTLTATLKQKTSLGAAEWFFNVTNLFNAFPVVYYSSTTTGISQGLPDGDDPIGRYFTLGFRLKM